MTDAHCHIARGEGRHFICEPADSEVGGRDVAFAGIHPWFLGPASGLRERLEADPRLGVGEIGLDRLKERTIPDEMREIFASQLALAAEFRRPTVLHGAKCWGEVVAACRPYKGKIPAFLFHGFSRSGGLVPDIAALNGFISVGPAILNDHAVNYRELAKAIPLNMLLVESDSTAENAAIAPHVEEIARKLADLRGFAFEELEAALEENANRFIETIG